MHDKNSVACMKFEPPPSCSGEKIPAVSIKYIIFKLGLMTSKISGLILMQCPTTLKTLRPCAKNQELRSLWYVSKQSWMTKSRPKKFTAAPYTPASMDAYNARSSLRDKVLASWFLVHRYDENVQYSRRSRLVSFNRLALAAIWNAKPFKADGQ